MVTPLHTDIPILGKKAVIEYELRCFDGGDPRLYAPFVYVDGQPVGFVEVAAPPAIPGLPPPAPGIPLTSPNRAFLRAWLGQRMPHATERETKRGLQAVKG